MKQNENTGEMLKYQTIGALGKIKHDILSKKFYTISLLIIFISLAWLFGFESAIFWLIFGSFLIYNWDKRILVIAAITSLISSLILLVIGEYFSIIFILIYDIESLPESLAIYAYNFLGIFLALEAISFINGGNARTIERKN